MGFSAKAKSSSSSSSENWGMGLFLVFFSDDDPILNKKKNPVSSATIRRNNSNLILTKAQSTISICALLVFITLLLFALSTFEPTIPSNPQFTTSRRYLSQMHQNYTHKIKAKPNSTLHHSPFSSSWFSKIWTKKPRQNAKIHPLNSNALQGMGKLYMRGTRAMNDLVVVHVMEDEIGDHLRLFLRVLHRSGFTARADVVFIFPSHLVSSVFDSAIREENDSFLKLVRFYREFNHTGGNSNSVVGFDLTQFVKHGKKEKERGEPIWGRKIRGNYSDSDGEAELSYGSVVGFDAAELDPENSLAGFLDHVPMSLRRWACYPMLLGRVRRNYKHIMLVEVKNTLILGDPLGRVRNRSPESVYLPTTAPASKSSKHNRKNSDKTRPVNPSIIMGGARGVRRLSNAVLTEIVRATMQRKGKNSVTESGILEPTRSQ
ncbi:hypothetical protein L1049_007939 [Liquidambar formosana]|uniref:DUF7780 domain-containing protein n=1 Tax=Liquidambar formosana TaxID=63359 RepID=A0AAP0X8T5_LIQFO